MLDVLQPPVSYAIFGALGGLLYILRQHLKGYIVRPVEYVARPVFGIVAAVALTTVLHIPNHFNSALAGYFGVDLWDASLSRFQGRFAGVFRHEKKPPSP